MPDALLEQMPLIRVSLTYPEVNGSLPNFSSMFTSACFDAGVILSSKINIPVNIAFDTGEPLKRTPSLFSSVILLVATECFTISNALSANPMKPSDKRALALRDSDMAMLRTARSLSVIRTRQCMVTERPACHSAAIKP